MIRTIWLAAVCLAALGAVTTGKVFTTAATIHETLADGVTVDAGLIQEPLNEGRSPSNHLCASGSTSRVRAAADRTGRS